MILLFVCFLNSSLCFFFIYFYVSPQQWTFLFFYYLYVGTLYKGSEVYTSIGILFFFFFGYRLIFDSLITFFRIRKKRKTVI